MTMPAHTGALSRVTAAVVEQAGIESSDSRHGPQRCQGPSSAEVLQPVAPARPADFRPTAGRGFEFCLRQGVSYVILRTLKRTESRMAGTVRPTYRSYSPLTGYAVGLVAMGA